MKNNRQSCGIYLLIIPNNIYVILQVQRPWNVRSGTISREFNIVVTPRVVEEVRNHFGCDDLDGAELEDQVAITRVCKQ